MDETIFFQIAKESLKAFFKEKGYTKCLTHKGRRHSVSFEKDTGNYTIPIDVKLFPDEYNGCDHFSVYFVGEHICVNEANPNENWAFKGEDDLREKFEEVKVKCIEQKFIEKVEEYAKSYFKY